MSEKTNPNPKYETTPEGLRNRLNDLSLDYLAYTVPSITTKDAAALYLDTPAGERIIIKKSVEGAQPAGYFFQDTIMSIMGSSPNPTAKQIDFNFNQFGDGLLRKRVTNGKDNGVELIPEGASDEGIHHLAKLTLHHSVETSKNIQLEQDMGLDNQPVTSEQVAEAMAYLDGASVLDPTNDYRPVGVIPAN